MRKLPYIFHALVMLFGAFTEMYMLLSFTLFVSFDWTLAGVKNICSNERLKSHAMSTTQGNLASPKGIGNLKDEPDHLLVLVHGIMAR